MWGVRRLSNYIDKKLPQGHPVLSQVKPFLAHALHCAELRLMRMGLSDVPVSQLPTWQRSGFLLAAARGKLSHSATKLWRRPVRLTDTYLKDPYLHQLLSEQREPKHMTH
jgi:hypothetical protein